MEKHRKQTSPAQAGLEPTGGGGCQNQTKRVRKKATVPRGPPTKCESNDGERRERRKRKNGHGGFQRGGGGTERFVVFGKNEVGIVSGFVRQSRKVKKKKRGRKKMKKDERRKKKEERR